ncbi:cleavage and polyadenylation specificity factor subunit 2-like isoform X2 [Quercus robur]|uniref:cleavage and polyadenylation specificity factor subunit 2-like isoform X2 n=1 Tax=Quercus robur TaxID=38942 RepID=UPI002162CE74|nr:cleavage and polyadenylation specificity factor subunit 2-like isoform X2 [Quercus robur]
MCSVQREPTLILSLYRQLQLPHRLWLERPLRPHSPPTSLQAFEWNCSSIFCAACCSNALNNQPYRRGEKENEFGETIKKTLGAGGNVLLPVDKAGRELELILTLEQCWSDKSLNYPIFFLTYVASSTIDYVKSFLEWMSDSIAKSFEQNRENPFLLKHVRFCISKSELDNAPDGPKVVLASMASLEVGFSHDIFVEWATDAKNLFLFTERGQIGIDS